MGIVENKEAEVEVDRGVAMAPGTIGWDGARIRRLRWRQEQKVEMALGVGHCDGAGSRRLRWR